MPIISYLKTNANLIKQCYQIEPKIISNFVATELIALYLQKKRLVLIAPLHMASISYINIEKTPACVRLCPCVPSIYNIAPRTRYQCRARVLRDCTM